MVLSDTKKGNLGWEKWFITGWAFMECLLFSGLLYGWGSINFVLKIEGIYADLCDVEGEANNTDVTQNFIFSNTTDVNSSNKSTTTDNITNGYLQICKPQDKVMALCFTIAAAMFGTGCLVFGFINYRFGIRTTRLIGTGMFTSGAIMMACISKENPWLLFPGFALISLGGSPIMLTNCQTAYFFTAGGASVVGLMHGGFSTSTVVMMLLKIAHEHGFIRRNMFILIAVLQSIVLISTFFFLPKYFIVKIKSVEDRSSENGSKLENKDVEQEHAIPSLKSCLLSFKFFTHSVWFAVLNLRFQYFIGTLNQYLTRVLHAEDQVSYFTDVCFYIMLSGLVLSFLSGAVYDNQKRKCQDGKSALYRELMPSVLPMALACMSAIFMSILVLIPETELLYLTFIVMTVFRSLFYCSAVAFIRSIFPSQYYGFMYGVLVVVGTIFATLQYAHFTWAEAYDNGPFHADTFLLCLTFLSFVHPLYWWITCWRDEKNSKHYLYNQMSQNKVSKWCVMNQSS